MVSPAEISISAEKNGIQAVKVGVQSANMRILVTKVRTLHSLTKENCEATLGI